MQKESIPCAPNLPSLPTPIPWKMTCGKYLPELILHIFFSIFEKNAVGSDHVLSTVITKRHSTPQGGKRAWDKWRSICSLVVKVRLQMLPPSPVHLCSPRAKQFTSARLSLQISDPKLFYLLLALSQGSQLTELEAPDGT